MSTSTWRCLQCTFDNSIAKTNCEMCNAANNAPDPIWRCAACTFDNAAGSNCSVCLTPKDAPDAVPLRAWSCKACGGSSATDDVCDGCNADINWALPRPRWTLGRRRAPLATAVVADPSDIPHDKSSAESFSDYYARVAEKRTNRADWAAFDALIQRLSFSGMWNPKDHLKFPAHDKHAVLAVLSLVRYNPEGNDVVYPQCALAVLPPELVMEILGTAFQGSQKVEQTSWLCTHCRQILPDHMFTDERVCYNHVEGCRRRCLRDPTSMCMVPHVRRERGGGSVKVPVCNPEKNPSLQGEWQAFVAQFACDPSSSYGTYDIYVLGHSGHPWGLLLSGDRAPTIFGSVDKYLTATSVLIDGRKIFITNRPTETCSFAAGPMARVAVERCLTCVVVCIHEQHGVSGRAVEVVTTMGQALRRAGF